MNVIEDLKEFLEGKSAFYNQPEFIESDPVQIPHRFERKEDIEIAAFLTAAISWGRRTMIIKKAEELMGLLHHNPYEFLMNATKADILHFHDFQYRTFKDEDAGYFIKSLQNIYLNYGGLHGLFLKGLSDSGSIKGALALFRDIFLSKYPQQRTLKHVADVNRGSAAKRLNMFLRWMVRQDNNGVDFGIWKDIPSSALMIPLDVHTGNVARKLGLLSRKQNDWIAVEELTGNLRKMDPEDPVKFDFALFGLGVFEDF
jgi:uncharacterized protein (TIGR02757 family)